MIYQWIRYWVPFGVPVHLNDGYLSAPSSILGKRYNDYIQTLDQVIERHCNILIGDPGIGKSIELQRAFIGKDLVVTTKTGTLEKLVWET